MSLRTRPILRPLLAALVALVAGAFPGGPVAADEAVVDVYDVQVGDNWFRPDPASIRIGTTVRWTHVGDIPHSVTADDGSFDSNPTNCPGNLCMRRGDVFTWRFTKAGSYPYFCKVHPRSHRGTVVVSGPPAETTIDAVSATPAGSGAARSVEVSGSALFGGQAPFVAGEDGTGDAPGSTDAHGLDVTSITIRQADPQKPVLSFAVNVTRLDAAPPPEVVRYMWDFNLVAEPDGAPKLYRAQAKTTDIVNTNTPSDPQKFATTTPSFRIRSNCGTVGVVSTCDHLGFLDGQFDTAKKQIRWDVPLSMLAGAKPGSQLVGDSFTASIQAVVSNDTTSDVVSPGEPYVIPGRTVVAALVPAGGAITEETPLVSATVDPDGGFGASVPAGSLPAGSYDLIVRADFGGNADEQRVPVTLGA